MSTVFLELAAIATRMHKAQQGMGSGKWAAEPRRALVAISKKVWEGKYRVSPLRPRWPVTVASFRTWRGWRDRVA